MLKIPDLASSPRVASDFLVQNVTDQFQISAGADLPQFGPTTNAEVQKGVAVTWNISAGKIDGQGAFTDVEITVSGNLAMSWSRNKNSLIVEGFNQVPFSARGDVIS